MNKPDKIAIYINARFLTQSITGVQRYSHEFVKALDNLLSENSSELLGYHFIMIAPKRKLFFEPKLKNIPLKKVGNFSGYIWEQLELPFYTKNGILFSPGNVAPILSLIGKGKNIVTVHSLSYKYFPTFYSLPFRIIYRILIPLVLKYAEKIITVSESEKLIIEKDYPFVKERLYAIQNGGFNKNLLTESENILPQKEIGNYILYVGSLNKSKNAQGIIEALKIIKNKTKEKLVIVGSSGKTFTEFPNLEKEIGEKIIFIGHINNTEKLISYYKGAKAFIFPSFYEASPLPPIEAMSLGIPVLASDIPALKERCNNAALYCNANNPNDIAEKILFLLSDTIAQKKYSALGKEHSKKFTWENCVIQTIKIIREMK